MFLNWFCTKIMERNLCLATLFVKKNISKKKMSLPSTVIRCQARFHVGFPVMFPRRDSPPYFPFMFPGFKSHHTFGALLAAQRSAGPFGLTCSVAQPTALLKTAKEARPETMIWKHDGTMNVEPSLAPSSDIWKKNR